MMLESTRMSDSKDKADRSDNGYPSFMWHGGGHHGNLKRVFSALCGGAAEISTNCAEIVQEAQDQQIEEQRRKIMRNVDKKDPYDPSNM